MKDHRALVPREPPEGLWEWATGMGLLDTCGMVYRKSWRQDTSPEAMLTRPGKKTPVVECTCSACGETVVMEYAPVHGPDGATYGFLVHNSGGAEVAISGESMLCPVCGCPVEIRCASKVGRDVYAGCEAFITAEWTCMSASLLPGEPGERPLVLIGWEMRRYCTKNGRNLNRCMPYEAYVFDGKDCAKLNGWVKGYGGTAGYYGMFLRDWRQPKDWSESWKRESHIYGLSRELLEDSCMHNAKLPEYLGAGIGGRAGYPVPYLRLYQQAPAVENLVTQGAGYLLTEMIGDAWSGNNKRGLVVPEELDLGQARPSAMLGLNRDEFRRIVGRTWSLELYRLYMACKGNGETLDDEEITFVFQLGEAEQLQELVGRAPIKKTIRYLYSQRESWEERMLYDEEIDLYVDPAEFECSFAEQLRDYWNCAETAGWDLNDPAVRWPKNLDAAHDRAAQAARTRVEQESKQLFKERYKALSKYTAKFDGILIRPCRTQSELTKEGQTMHHCVAGYAKDVATGKTAIFFLRRLEDPGTPWYTLELDERKLEVKQNRGLRNCARTDEVQAFEDKWLEWLRSGAKKDKDGNAVWNKKKTVSVA